VIAAAVGMTTIGCDDDTGTTTGDMSVPQKGDMSHPAADMVHSTTD
jgi:hypothetical protein